MAWNAYRSVYFPQLAQKTKEEYTAAYRMCLAAMPDLITPAAILRWHRCDLLGSGKYSAAYANTNLRTMRSVVRRAAVLTGDNDLMSAFWQVPQVREPTKAPRCPPIDFLGQALKLAKGRAERAFFLLAGLAGLRIGELLGLKPEDLDGDVLRVVRQRKHATRKNRRPHSVKIDHPELLECLRWTIANPDKIKCKNGWHRGQCDGHIFPWAKKKCDLMIARLRAALGEKYLPGGGGWHSFRHWGATMLAKTGASCWDVQCWLGDSDPKMAVLYVAMTRGETNGSVSQIAKFAGLDRKRRSRNKKTR